MVCIINTQHLPQSKLVRVIQGKALDIAVDIRKGSPTFGKWVSVELSEDNKGRFLSPTVLRMDLWC